MECRRLNAKKHYEPRAPRRVKGNTRICKRGHKSVVGESCGPCDRIIAKDQRARDGEKGLARSRRWYSEYPEKGKASSRRWQIANPERVQAIRGRRYAAQRGADGELTAEEWIAILKKYRHSCAYCGIKGEPLQQDHVVPLQGKKARGTHYAFNIVPACGPCNNRKRNKILPNVQFSLFDRILT